MMERLMADCKAGMMVGAARPMADRHEGMMVGADRPM
eukprot:CAMPEP_0172547104 /NCGR_PEP_ID=MMETSP1067-20121228/16707_1 /TAXON_ID=265564 ORGANISM="Thalassiosira punctigera, Strain Tpunct2005C2" /NCGR_SAMPLE_ID=MMETSP1067 /ASSEMBLY_ACC=CAM_ASM_000444 /LENGTH=36 /DNA_ID= /DNA_START= /DNA_END= /DNA_ORIENTATION=